MISQLGHVDSATLVRLARYIHRRAQRVRRTMPAARQAAEILDVKRRCLMDDARQSRRRRPHGKRCDERAGYGFHVCAMDRGHKGDVCRCRCGEEFGPPF